MPVQALADRRDKVPPSFGSPGVSISYRPKRLQTPPSSTLDHDAAAPTLTVTVPPASIKHIFAHRQWRAGMLMSDAIVSGAFPVDSKNVLELGAGTALPSITAALSCRPELVVASDYDEPELIRALRQNVKNNMAIDPAKASIIRVCGHIWGKNPEELFDCFPQKPLSSSSSSSSFADSRSEPRFQVILLADCLWDPLSHADLLKTLVSTLDPWPEARVHVIAGLHTGREKITSFIRRAARAGLVLAPVVGQGPGQEPIWPRCEEQQAPLNRLLAPVSEDDPLRFAHERIVELEVSGNKPIASSEEDASASKDLEVEAHADEPRLTGRRRIFVPDLPQTGEEPIEERNKWLTFWSLRWKQSGD
ncbi:hypothetical protein IE53DRAFT_222403 [Violaceomyces palustris]|uniref:Uncharacterized protein n=1 Tax=Violaceomyces palustris TaxID=1673888 RepID=A0ACD0P515_9BASI|nr:hypothetical protein IE53DRAFT_222403 [Violaceomyces palustris]